MLYTISQFKTQSYIVMSFCPQLSGEITHVDLTRLPDSEHEGNSLWIIWQKEQGAKFHKSTLQGKNIFHPRKHLLRQSNLMYFTLKRFAVLSLQLIFIFIFSEGFSSPPKHFPLMPDAFHSPFHFSPPHLFSARNKWKRWKTEGRKYYVSFLWVGVG